jgi:hypothetical protein
MTVSPKDMSGPEASDLTRRVLYYISCLDRWFEEQEKGKSYYHPFFSTSSDIAVHLRRIPVHVLPTDNEVAVIKKQYEDKGWIVSAEKVVNVEWTFQSPER